MCSQKNYGCVFCLLDEAFHVWFFLDVKCYRNLDLQNNVMSLLVQPKWNDALLEMFRNEYIGTAPYISCLPSLRHHRLCPGDQFLVLSSDGLYQYFSNQEVVSHVENFMEKFPDGDPAQHLIEELLNRAAKKAGISFFYHLKSCHFLCRHCSTDQMMVYEMMQELVEKLYDVNVRPYNSAKFFKPKPNLRFYYLKYLIRVDTLHGM